MRIVLVCWFVIGMTESGPGPPAAGPCCQFSQVIREENSPRDLLLRADSVTKGKDVHQRAAETED